MLVSDRPFANKSVTYTVLGSATITYLWTEMYFYRPWTIPSIVFGLYRNIVEP